MEKVKSKMQKDTVSQPPPPHSAGCSTLFKKPRADAWRRTGPTAGSHVCSEDTKEPTGATGLLFAWMPRTTRMPRSSEQQPKPGSVSHCTPRAAQPVVQDGSCPTQAPVVPTPQPSATASLVSREPTHS